MLPPKYVSVQGSSFISFKLFRFFFLCWMFHERRLRNKLIFFGGCESWRLFSKSMQFWLHASISLLHHSIQKLHHHEVYFYTIFQSNMKVEHSHFHFKFASRYEQFPFQLTLHVANHVLKSTEISIKRRKLILSITFGEWRMYKRPNINLTTLSSRFISCR